MRISFGLTSCKDDAPQANTLVGSLMKFIKTAKPISSHDYEIIWLMDAPEVKGQYTPELYSEVPEILPWFHPVNKEFAAHKNFLNSKCTGDWILQLDADEIINETFLFNFPAIIESNPEIEAYWLPRVNTVDGLTLEHVRKWNWILTTLSEFTAGKMIDPASEEYRLLKEYNYIINEENGRVDYYQPIICWPDYQCRLYKNDPKIKWEGNVHEQLVGFEHYTRFPLDSMYAIEHHKNIARQEQQNSLYETIKR